MLLQVKRMRVDVETCSPLSAGQTVCDVWSRSPLGPNVTVALVRNYKCSSSHAHPLDTHFWGVMQNQQLAQ